MINLVDNGSSKLRASELSGVSRSMLYYRRKGRDRRFDNDLESGIRDIVEKRPSYGSRRIRVMLQRDGIYSGRNRIRRHMRHLNLMNTEKRVRKKVPRSMVVSRPNLMWETDFTKIYVDNYGWAYLSAYVDLCSRRIKGYLTSSMARTGEMIQAMDNAIFSTFPDMNIPHLTVRSDNGSQLTSKGYEGYLRSLGIYHETIHAHTPEEDGHIESYFGHFKEDYIYSREFRSFDELSGYIDWAVSDYNTVRPHSSLNYMTPNEFEAKIVGDKAFREEWIEKQKRRNKNAEFLE
jgi:putative transposase